jgi:hypothetical protein
MSTPQLKKRLQRLERHHQHAARCRCVGSARFVSPISPAPSGCNHCGREPLTITVNSLPTRASIPIPAKLVAALQRAANRRGQLNLALLTNHELEQLETLLTSAC